MKLTDELIEGAVESITGYIVARAADEKKLPLDTVMEVFLASNTYKLLSDKSTGLYWDTLEDTYEMFLSELNRVFPQISSLSVMDFLSVVLNCTCL